MSQLDDIKSAIIKADKAGDTKSAAYLVKKYKELSAKPTEAPQTLGGDLKAFGTGTVQGLAFLNGGWKGDLNSTMEQGANWLENKIAPGLADKIASFNPVPQKLLRAVQPTTADTTNTLLKPLGGPHNAENIPEEIFQTTGALLPSAIGGPESLALRLATRSAIPAATSVAGGHIVPDSSDPIQHWLHVAAQTGGAILGGMGSAATLPRVVGGVKNVIERGAAASVPETAEQVSNRYLGQLLQKMGPAGSPEAIRSAGRVSAAGTTRDMTGAEALGPGGVDVLGTLARRDPLVSAQLTDQLTTRTQGMRDRMISDVSQAAGIPADAAKGNIEALVAAGQQKAAPLFKKALDVPGAVMTPDLESVLRRPAIKNAMSAAAVSLRNGGKDPTALGLHFDETGNMTAMPAPTARAWDLTKKALGQAVERDTFGRIKPDSESAGNHDINIASRDLTKAMTDAIPGYRDALDVSGDYLSSKSAFEAGQTMFRNGKVSGDDFQKYFDRLKPADQDAVKTGIVHDLYKMGQGQGPRLTPTLVEKKVIQSKLATAFGPWNAYGLIQDFAKEAELAANANRMKPGTGSFTSNAIFNAGDMDAATNASGALHAGQAVAHAATHNYLGAARSGLSAMRHFGLLGGRQMTPETMQALANLLRASPDELATYVSKLPAPQNASALGRLLTKQGNPP